jgi:hypothetical protein
MHGALMFPNWQPAPEPEVWECYGVPFRSVADINGDMLFVLGIGSIVYAPAANPLDFVPIPGAAIKMLVIGYSADYAEGTVSLAAMTLASNLIPTSGTMAILSESIAGVGDIPSELVYPDLPAGFTAAVSTLELRARTAIQPTSTVIESLAPGQQVAFTGTLLDVHVNGQKQLPSMYTTGQQLIENKSADTWDYVELRTI